MRAAMRAASVPMRASCVIRDRPNFQLTEELQDCACVFSSQPRKELLLNLTPYEISRDLASLVQLLPESQSLASFALRGAFEALRRGFPESDVVRLIAQGLDSPEQDDAEERAILAALLAILRPHRWTAHTGDACPVDGRALVVADLGDGQPLTERADSLNWGDGTGPAGEGRIRRFAVVGHA